MPKENSVEIVFVVDSSGSMERIKGDTEGGINSFIEEQRKAAGECKVTLVTFSSSHTIVHNATPIENVSTFVLTPRGNTALLDTLGHTINLIGDRLSHTAESERPSKVIFVISTDGEENCSREFNRAQIFDMIKHQMDKYSWDFVYLGANQNAIAVGQSLGIAAARAVTYAANAVGTRGLYRGLSNAVLSSRLNGAAMNYDQQAYTASVAAEQQQSNVNNT